MSYISDFEHTKLDAQVFPGYIVQKHYLSSLTSGQRRVPISKIWKVERLLGKGTFGEVRLETSTSDYKHSEECRAVKRIWTTGAEFKKSYERELKALLEFSKPKYKESAVFVGFLGWFDDLESVYLAMEYLPLGDLEDNVNAVGGSIKGVEVKEIARQVCEGLKIMHLENFAHRDLKPKNVLVCRGPPNWWVKLADFGLTKLQTDETGLRTQTGTFAYMAPEILNYIPGVQVGRSKYTNAVDTWALGCIVYRLACGVVPFPPGLSLVEFCKDASKFPSRSLPLSDDGTHFVRNLIKCHPAQRLTAQQALDHPWMKADLEVPDISSDSIAFSGYDTATHLGLRSEEPVNASSNTVKAGAAKRGIPKGYRPPTVEDEETTRIAEELSSSPETSGRHATNSGESYSHNKTMEPPNPESSSKKPLKKYPSPPPTLPSRKERSQSRNADYPFRRTYDNPLSEATRFTAGSRDEDESPSTGSDSDNPLYGTPSRPPSPFPEPTLYSVQESRAHPVPIREYKVQDSRARSRPEPTVYRFQDYYPSPVSPHSNPKNYRRAWPPPMRTASMFVPDPNKFTEANYQDDFWGPSGPLTAEMLEKHNQSTGGRWRDFWGRICSDAAPTTSRTSGSPVSDRCQASIGVFGADDYEYVDYRKYSCRSSPPGRFSVSPHQFRENQASKNTTAQTETIFYADQNGYIDTQPSKSYDRPSDVDDEVAPSKAYSKKDR